MIRKTDSIAPMLDVIIIGAGLAGIAAAQTLRGRHPHKSFLVLDAYDGHGGTWRSHRYPGVRSDSDLFTYGFRFKPWTGAPVASGAEIMTYMEEAIEENDLAGHFRFRCRVTHAGWDSATASWRISGVRGEDDQPFETSCAFLWMCQGYYRHSRGYTPEWPGLDDFTGQLVHPQHWPEDLDHAGKDIVVIGSGATAATVVPALSRTAAHVTMLQRSPTYFSLAPNRHPLADMLRQLEVDEAIVHNIVRRKVTYDQNAYFIAIKTDPEKAKADLLATLPAWLSEDDKRKHFTPAYHPWQQRVALTPDGELFDAIRSGRVTMVTDTIERFTATGIQLNSGDTLEAEIVVTATGFELSIDGDIAFSIDGRPFRFEDTVSYRGILFTGVPNLARFTGYLRLSSWTLRVELIADLVSRIMSEMDEIQASTIEVGVPGDGDQAIGRSTDVLPFTASYARRGRASMPQSGPTPEWHAQDYWIEKDAFAAIDLRSQPFVYRDRAGRRVERDTMAV